MRWLARYGLTGLAYDNRGTGTSGGDCKTTTIETESQDIPAALRALAGRDRCDRVRLGLWGNSAAGWYVPQATTCSYVRVAFLVTKIGPTTSVEAQRNGIARYIAEGMTFAVADCAKMLCYVDLMFAAERPKDGFRRDVITTCQRRAHWIGRRVPDARPRHRRRAGRRRRAHDPADELQQMNVPFLAFFGEEVRITPIAENAPLLRRLHAEVGSEDARAVVVAETGHGLGQGSSLRRLQSESDRMDGCYCKFYYVAFDYTATLVDVISEDAFNHSP